MNPNIKIPGRLLALLFILLASALACGFPVTQIPTKIVIPTGQAALPPSIATATAPGAAPAITATALPPSPTPAPTVNLTPFWDGNIAGSWSQVVHPGFGNHNNMFSDITQFGSHLYISTISLSDNFVYSGSHKAGGEIWRTGNGTDWYMAADTGMGNIRNVGMNMAVFKDMLIVGGTNYIDGARIWTSTNGVNYNTITNDGLGDVQNTRFNFSVFNNKLIISSCNEIFGGGLWLSIDGANMLKTTMIGGRSPKNTCWVTGSQPGVVFNGYLYYGTTNKDQGAQIWRTNDGLKWAKVATGGLGSTGNFTFRPEIVYNNQLYVLSMNYDGFQLFRTSDGTAWEKVVDNGFSAARFNKISCRLAAFNNQLYLITINQDRRQIGRPIQIVQDPAGFQLYSSTDGKKWDRAAPDGFGNINNTTGEIKVIGNQLYVETGYNFVDGSEIWRSSDGQKWQMIYKTASPGSYHMNAAVYPYLDTLYAVTNDLQYGVEVWQEDKNPTPSPVP